MNFIGQRRINEMKTKQEIKNVVTGRVGSKINKFCCKQFIIYLRFYLRFILICLKIKVGKEIIKKKFSFPHTSGYTHFNSLTPIVA